MDWEERLSAAGYRLTAARRAVIQVLAASTVPLAPHEICQLGQVVHPALGLVTVYRTLELLVEFGLVRRVHHDDGCHRYLVASNGHGDAVLCRHCGQAVEFPGKEELEGLIARVQQATGYRVQDYMLQLIGLCPGCQG